MNKVAKTHGTSSRSTKVDPNVMVVSARSTDTRPLSQVRRLDRLAHTVFIRFTSRRAMNSLRSPLNQAKACGNETAPTIQYDIYTSPIVIVTPFGTDHAASIPVGLQTREYGYTVPATSGTSAPTSPTSQANDSKSSDSSVLHRQVSHRVEPTTAEFTGSKYTNSVSRE